MGKGFMGAEAPSRRGANGLYQRDREMVTEKSRAQRRLELLEEVLHFGDSASAPEPTLASHAPTAICDVSSELMFPIMLDANHNDDNTDTFWYPSSDAPELASCRAIKFLPWYEQFTRAPMPFRVPCVVSIGSQHLCSGLVPSTSVFVGLPLLQYDERNPWPPPVHLTTVGGKAELSDVDIANVQLQPGGISCLSRHQPWPPPVLAEPSELSLFLMFAPGAQVTGESVCGVSLCLVVCVFTVLNFAFTHSEMGIAFPLGFAKG